MATIDDRSDARNAALSFVARLERDGKSQTAAYLRAQLDAATDAPPTPAPSSHRRPLPPPQTHRRGPKRTRAQQASTRAQRARARDAAHLARLDLKIRAHGGTPTAIRNIPITVWTQAAQVMADQTGRAARLHLRRADHRSAAGAILRAALGTGKQTADRSWSDLRTRRIAALGLALLALSKNTRRHGPWGALVIGVPRGALAALLRDPFDRRHNAAPSTSALFGTHRKDADPTSADVGYFPALRAAGMVYSQQLPKAEAHPCETWGPTGYAFNRYWLLTDAAWKLDSAEARAALAELAELADLDARALSAEQTRHRRDTADDDPPPK